MNIKKIKVYHLFWIVTVLILLIGLSEINNPDSVICLNIYDTYYVISHYHLSIVLFLSFFLMGLGYWLVQKIFQKQLLKILTIIHSVILIGSFVFYWVILFYCKLFLTDPFALLNSSNLINITLFFELLLIVFIGIPVYIINLLIGLFRKSYIS